MFLEIKYIFYFPDLIFQPRTLEPEIQGKCCPVSPLDMIVCVVAIINTDLFVFCHKKLERT